MFVIQQTKFVYIMRISYHLAIVYVWWNMNNPKEDENVTKYWRFYPLKCTTNCSLFVKHVSLKTMLCPWKNEWNPRLTWHVCPSTEGVLTNNQRGRRSGPCLLLEGLDKSRQECNVLGKICTRLWEGQAMAYGPLDDHWVILSTSKAFNYFQARRDKIRCVFDFL